MENKCKIVQDLLPTYIENMTTEETTNFIKEHLETCKNCQEIYEAMKEDIEKENIENTETVRKIKKYRRKIILIKVIFFAIIFAIIATIIGNIAYKFYVVKKAYTRNTNYKAFESFTVEEYVDNVEHYEKHYTTYYKNDIMKKYYGNDVVEYYDGENHYFFDNENNTYWVKKEKVNTTLNIDISILEGTENIIKDGKISNLEILKFVLFQEDLEIREYGFRQKAYHLISCKNNSIWIDQDTFYAERLVEDYDFNPETYDEPKEYRVRTANVGWREIQEPDFSKYTLIEK